jgi:hypothetical protein
VTAFSDFLENELLDHVLRGPANAYPSPVQVFVSLHTASPGDTGVPANEVAGGGYTRQPGNFAAAVAGATTNTGNIAFTNMPAVTVTHVAIYDALTAGNLLFHGALTAPQVVNAGDTFVFNAGDLDVSLD